MNTFCVRVRVGVGVSVSVRVRVRVRARGRVMVRVRGRVTGVRRPKLWARRSTAVIHPRAGCAPSAWSAWSTAHRHAPPLASARFVTGVATAGWVRLSSSRGCEVSTW